MSAHYQICSADGNLIACIQSDVFVIGNPFSVQEGSVCTAVITQKISVTDFLDDRMVANDQFIVHHHSL